MCRRFSDFVWLNIKLQGIEKYKGCVFPPLPTKNVLSKNSTETVEKRREELQIYMQILAHDSLIKYDSTLKFFLTCENFEEFEQFKSNPNDFVQSNTMGMLPLKEMQIKDTFNYLYSSIKTKLVKNEEPLEMKSGLELETLDEKVLNYVNFLNKMVALITFRIEHTKRRLEDHGKLVKALETTQDSDPEIEQTFQDLASFYEGEEAIISKALKNDIQLLNEIKATKLKQEGIHNAIIDRKNVFLLFYT